MKIAVERMPRSRFGQRLSTASIAWTWAAVGACLIALTPGLCDAKGPEPKDPPPLSDDQFEPTPEMQQLVQRLVRENLPTEYSNEKKWNRTKDFSALRLRREDGHLGLRRVKRPVNHGRWKKYKATLIRPEKELKIRLGPMHRLPQGPIAVQVIAEGRLNAIARVANWRRGVMLYSVAADADAKIRLTLDCEVELALDPSRLPPDVIIKAQAREAQVELLDFELNSVSDVRGDLAEGLGKLIENLVEDAVTDANDKLVKKVNESLDKHQDKLRISAASLVTSTWSELLSSRP